MQAEPKPADRPLVLCDAKRCRFVPEIPAAQWNKIRALFVDKSLEIRFCENTQLIPLRRRSVRDVSVSLIGAWQQGRLSAGSDLRLHPRLSNVVHLRRTHSGEQNGRKLEPKSKKRVSKGSLKHYALRRRREDTSAKAPKPVSKPNTEGSGMA